MKKIESNNSKGTSPEKQKKEILKKSNSLQRREALKRMAILAAGSLTGVIFIGSCDKYSDYYDYYSDYSSDYYSNYYTDYYNYNNYYSNYAP